MSCLLTWRPVSTPPPPYDLWEPLLFLCNYVSLRYSLFPPHTNILFIRQNVINWPKNVKQNSMFLIFPSIVLKTVPQYCKSQWCAQLCSVVQNLLSSTPKCKTFARCTYLALSALCSRDWKNLAKTWSQMQERKMRVISRRPILSWSSFSSISSLASNNLRAFATKPPSRSGQWRWKVAVCSRLSLYTHSLRFAPEIGLGIQRSSRCTVTKAAITAFSPGS